MQHIWYSDALWGLPPRAIHFWHAMLCKRGLCRHTVPVRPSVRPSVTFVHSVEMNKHIYKYLSPSDSHTILIFPSWQYSDGNPPNRGIECMWGRPKSRFWAHIWLHCVPSMLWLAMCYQHGAAWSWQVVTLIAGSKRWSLLMAGDDGEMFVTRSFNVTSKTQEQLAVI